MKSYLNLAGIQAKVHKKQNLMTIFCITLAVFLITGVFTMADVARKQEMIRMTAKHGSWHISLENISEDDMESVLSEPAVKKASRYDVLNYDL